MPKTARKFIIIPEFAPLYAMRTCFGPTHGPLKQPTPTPIDVIGMLLKQRGDEKLTIMEVVKLSNGEFSTPVLLTPLNYRLPYDEIIRLEQEDATVGEVVSTPIVEEDEKEDIPDNTEETDISVDPNVLSSDTVLSDEAVEKVTITADQAEEDPIVSNEAEMLNAIAEELSAKESMKPQPNQNKRSGKKNHNRK